VLSVLWLCPSVSGRDCGWTCYLISRHCASRLRPAGQSRFTNGDPFITPRCRGRCIRQAGTWYGRGKLRGSGLTSMGNHLCNKPSVHAAAVMVAAAPRHVAVVRGTPFTAAGSLAASRGSVGSVHRTRRLLAVRNDKSAGTSLAPLAICMVGWRCKDGEPRACSRYALQGIGR
jgi:hypothetical protein